MDPILRTNSRALLCLDRAVVPAPCIVPLRFLTKKYRDVFIGYEGVDLLISLFQVQRKGPGAGKGSVGWRSGGA